MHEQKHFVKYLLTFVFIFIIMIAAVFSIHYSGILGFDTIGATTTDSIDTLPSDTTSSESISQTSSQTQTTETTESLTDTEDRTQTESTERSTKYPPATLPIIPTQTTSSKTTATTEKTTVTTVTTTQTTTSETTTTETTTTEITTTETTTTKPITPEELHKITAEDITDEKMAELITKKYLTVHSKSRPGYKLWSVKNIVVHYVANPGTSALQNWKYFENKNNVSAHFIIDIDGSIIQCMPTNEVAWAVGTKNGNYTSISIECCHPDSTGEFTEETYISLLKLVSWLCAEYDLDRDDVIRHYDYGIQKSWGVYHKACPLYYANDKEPASHERWEKFREEIYIK
ncbi:MAG: N-acetylmuramoyl-L-alanine amidase [Clostridia bacterium]|nr:N-acetylmuramoyl-L-alanine amidase [Clostridia bacterium]